MPSAASRSWSFHDDPTKNGAVTSGPSRANCNPSMPSPSANATVATAAIERHAGCAYGGATGVTTEDSATDGLRAPPGLGGSGVRIIGWYLPGVVRLLARVSKVAGS